MPIKRLHIVLLTSVILAAGISPAAAQFYLSGHAAGTIMTDADTTDTITGASISGEVGFDAGYGFTGAAGYAWDATWGAFRLEGELSYRENDLDNLSVTSVTAGGTTLAGALGNFSLDGSISTIGLMVNGWYDFDTGTSWVPYVGAGVGGAQVSIDISRAGTTAVSYDETDFVIAYQAGAGLGYKISPKTTARLEYRLFSTDDPVFNDGIDRIESEYMNHSFMLGISMMF